MNLTSKDLTNREWGCVAEDVYLRARNAITDRKYVVNEGPHRLGDASPSNHKFKLDWAAGIDAWPAEYGKFPKSGSRDNLSIKNICEVHTVGGVEDCLPLEWQKKGDSGIRPQFLTTPVCNNTGGYYNLGDHNSYYECPIRRLPSKVGEKFNVRANKGGLLIGNHCVEFDLLAAYTAIRAATKAAKMGFPVKTYPFGGNSGYGKGVNDKGWNKVAMVSLKWLSKQSNVNLKVFPILESDQELVWENNFKDASIEQWVPELPPLTHKD